MVHCCVSCNHLCTNHACALRVTLKAHNKQKAASNFWWPAAKSEKGAISGWDYASQWAAIKGLEKQCLKDLVDNLIKQSSDRRDTDVEDAHVLALQISLLKEQAESGEFRSLQSGNAADIHMEDGSEGGRDRAHDRSTTDGVNHVDLERRCWRLPLFHFEGKVKKALNKLIGKYSPDITGTYSISKKKGKGKNYTPGYIYAEGPSETLQNFAGELTGKYMQCEINELGVTRRGDQRLYRGFESQDTFPHMKGPPPGMAP